MATEPRFASKLKLVLAEKFPEKEFRVDMAFHYRLDGHLVRVMHRASRWSVDTVLDEVHCHMPPDKIAENIAEKLFADLAPKGVFPPVDDYDAKYAHLRALIGLCGLELSAHVLRTEPVVYVFKRDHWAHQFAREDLDRPYEWWAAALQVIMEKHRA